MLLSKVLEFVCFLICATHTFVRFVPSYFVELVATVDEIHFCGCFFHHTFSLSTANARSLLIHLCWGEPRESPLNVIQSDMAQHTTKPW